MTRSDGGGSESYSASVTHQSNGLYEATLTPLIAGDYSMTVELTNDYTVTSGVAIEISGSPFTVTVYPGQVDPPVCSTDISTLVATASASYDF